MSMNLTQTHPQMESQINELPFVTRQPSQLMEDLAANSPDRHGLLAPILGWLFDPGFQCVTLIRIATMPRTNIFRKIAAKWAKLKLERRFNCYISFEAKFGRRLVLPHPVGIIVGEVCKVGDDVTIFQHVTLGRRDKDVVQYPVIGDGATLYAGSVILGAIHIGPGALVGANAVVLKNVPSGASVGGVPARLLRSRRAPSNEWRSECDPISA